MPEDYRERIFKELDMIEFSESFRKFGWKHQKWYETAQEECKNHTKYYQMNMNANFTANTAMMMGKRQDPKNVPKRVGSGID